MAFSLGEIRHSHRTTQIAASFFKEEECAREEKDINDQKDVKDIKDAHKKEIPAKSSYLTSC
jgi:hypothetical protein